MQRAWKELLQHEKKRTQQYSSPQKESKDKADMIGKKSSHIQVVLDL